MHKIESEVFGRTEEINRIIGRVDGEMPGPTVVFVAGIHGNEPSGVFALVDTLKNLKQHKSEIRGTIIALAGNLWAMERGVRYHEQDLNRLWTADRIPDLEADAATYSNEDQREQIDIHRTVRRIINEEQGPFYFFDLHTTSSETIPFIVVNDSLLNRKFTEMFPLPLVLGIEEYLVGPLLSYLNEKGYVSFAFEAGSHSDPMAYDIQLAFINLALAYSNVIPKAIANFDHHHAKLARTSVNTQHFFEIYYRFRIPQGADFKMEPGFVNFEPIRRKQHVATCDDKKIIATRDGQVFMPLYQSQGEDGFFAIRKIPPVFFAHFSFDEGAQKSIACCHCYRVYTGPDKTHSALRVNRTVARFFTKQVFHLLGYRSRRQDQAHLYHEKPRRGIQRRRVLWRSVVLNPIHQTMGPLRHSAYWSLISSSLSMLRCQTWPLQTPF